MYLDHYGSEAQMRYLVIDDMREFRTAPTEAAVVYARTSKQGKRILRDDKCWDRIYLDHDLGYDHSGGMDSIEPVLDYIEMHVDDFDCRTQFYVITSNPYAGDMMVRTLSVCGLQVVRHSPFQQFHYIF